MELVRDYERAREKLERLRRLAGPWLERGDPARLALMRAIYVRVVVFGWLGILIGLVGLVAMTGVLEW